MMKIVISEMNWPNGNRMLEEQGFTVVYDPALWQDREALRQQLQDADALIVRNQTQVNEELLAGAGKLRVVGRLGVGLDNIDLTYVTQRGIPVVAGKNANATSVAEYVLAAILTSSRQLQAAGQDVRSGGWNRKRFTGREIGGSTLGLIGVGEIGQRVAMRARAFGMKVIGYDPFVAPYDFAVSECGIRLCGLDQVFRESDYISLHVPLTPETRHLVNRESLAQMKPTAVLINTARGGIVEETSLAEALGIGLLREAYLDVLEQEPPPPEHPLLQLDNCVMTPHVAGLTEESQVRVSAMVAEEVAKELAGNRSLCRVNLKR